MTMCLGMALAGLPCTSCSDPEQGGGVQVTGVTLDRKTLALVVDGDAVLEATIEPAEATDRRLVWESSDPTVATVSAGYVVAFAVGTTTVTATTRDGNFSDGCVVTVSQPVGKITFKWPSATVEIGGAPYTMQATVTPETAGDKSLIWETDDRKIATVSATGAVTAVAAGKTTIRATATDGSGTAAAWTVTVIPPPDMASCRGGEARWGADLGVVSFKTDGTWQTGELLWSDVVMSSVCSARTSYLGRDSEMLQYYCDCRKGNDGFGNLFSWCGMALVRHQICPDGWRVPTMDDFVALDKALGGTGENRPYLSYTGPDVPILAKYTGPEWGGGYGGNVTWDNVLAVPGVEAYYWGQTVEPSMNTYAIYLGFKTNGHIFVQQSSRKDFGMPVRCVR